MSTFTENYDFIKPDNEDYYDIQDFNENMDAIDAQLAAAEQKAAAIQASIATAEERLEQPMPLITATSSFSRPCLSIAFTMAPVITPLPQPGHQM